MNYDSSISSEVSLSRILDEMILDNTPHEVVMEFLRSHQSSLEDIYRNSNFMFNLYDLTNGCGFLNPFMLDNMHRLHPADLMYALSQFGVLYLHGQLPLHLKRDFVKIKGHLDSSLSKLGMRASLPSGIPSDIQILTGNVDFVEYLNTLLDERDMKHFLNSSVLARSAFGMDVFCRLNPATQYVLLKVAFERMFIFTREYELVAFTHSHFLVCLLKQLLVDNNMEMANWVFGVIRDGVRQWDSERVLGLLSLHIHKDLPSGIQGFLDSDWGYGNNHPDSDFPFEELVFQLNLQESQFDPIDLFMFIYLSPDDAFSKVRTNSDLIEFFNLPFDWTKLDRFSHPTTLITKEA